MKAPYPADDFLASARARLASRGWKELQTDWLNPTIPSSHARGWTSFLDTRTRPSMGVHQWSADWQNRPGDVVLYSLRYQSPVSDARHEVPPPAGDDLEVTEMLIPATMARAMRDDAVRRARGVVR